MSHYPCPFNTILLNEQSMPITPYEVSKLPNIPFIEETTSPSVSYKTIVHLPVKGMQIQPPTVNFPLQPNTTFSPLSPTPVQTAPQARATQPLFPEAPIFSGHPNPLLPPEYQGHLDYNNLQYMNGFLRTQIGKPVEVEFLIGDSCLATKTGVLFGVGDNYILLQDTRTGDITACDFNSIKFIKFFMKNNQLIALPK